VSSKGTRTALRLCCVALLAGVLVGFAAPFAFAQTGPEVIDSEVVGESVRLVSSKEEVRRAVFGLLGIAAALSVATALYWHKSGQDAKVRFALAHPRPRTIPDEPTAALRTAGIRRHVARPSSPQPAAPSGTQAARPVVRPGASVFDAAPERPAAANPTQPPALVPSRSVFDQPTAVAPPSPPAPAPRDPRRPGGAPRSATPAETAPTRSRVEPTLSAEEWWAAVAPGEGSTSPARQV
jgi:hypothetical protein